MKELTINVSDDLYEKLLLISRYEEFAVSLLEKGLKARLLQDSFFPIPAPGISLRTFFW
jgi:hypothetical protein